jgi:hypothetical protein
MGMGRYRCAMSWRGSLPPDDYPEQSSDSTDHESAELESKTLPLAPLLERYRRPAPIDDDNIVWRVLDCTSTCATRAGSAPRQH